MDELKNEFSLITSASNYPRLLFNIQSQMLRGNTADAEVEILRDGKIFTIKMKRALRGNAQNRLKDRDPNPNDSSYKFINTNIGYFFPGKYKDSQFDKIIQAFKNTKALIIDFRSYPSDCTDCLFNSWINTNDIHGKSTKGNVYTPGLFTYASKIKRSVTDSEYYKGKIVVIVNEITVSAAEGQVNKLSTAPNVTIIGTTTAGANGSNVTITLPGNVMTSFTGIGVYRFDGRWAQRSGITIDVPVNPTMKGIKEGRDELLEKAIEIIQASK
jgi:C-terminal processing protease CtpA/Prc